MKGNKTDWEKIRREYAKGKTLRELGKEFGVDFRTIGKRAKKEGWGEDRQQIADETATKVACARAHAYAREGETRADRLRKTEETAEKLADLLERTCTYLESAPVEAMVANLKGLQSLASAIKTNGEQLAMLYGVVGPYQAKRLEIDREKLDMERRKAELEHQTGGVTITIKQPEGEPLDE